MFLAIDIGNTRINVALFNNNKIIRTLNFDTTNNPDSNFYKHKFAETFNKYPITDCGIISVVNDFDKILKEACDNVFGLNSLILSYKNANKISFDTNTPECIGLDRIANICAVKDNNLPAIVVDIGTAITFDILSKDNLFLGGIIMPGISMKLKSLHTGTSKLPEIKPKLSEKAIGNTTESNILSGVIRGTASAIDGLLEQCIDELGDCKTIILTGGQSELISKYMKHSFNKIDKHLTLNGIKKMYFN